MSNALYTDLSDYYDLMCADINYNEQCNTAFRLHRIFGEGGANYLDLACGTGSHIEHFIRFGYNATGLDVNKPMLVRAALRCPSATFSHQNMSSFFFEQRFDLITCFLYSIHYCYPQKSFFSALQNAFNTLSPGGVFCFDSVDKNTIANDNGFKHSAQKDDVLFHFQSRWFYSGKGDKLDLHLSIKRQVDNMEQYWKDQHSMLATTIPDLKKVLEDIGFNVTILERDFLKLEPWKEENGNVIFVCTKPEN